MRKVALDAPLYGVLGQGSLLLRRLERLGLATVRDLLWYFPSRYEDFSKTYRIAELEPGQQATIRGVVEEVHSTRSWRRRMAIVEATIADESGTIRAVWFNQPYVANILKTGRLANFSGKISISEEGEAYLSHPAYELLRAGAQESGAEEAEGAPETRHTARLVPVYPETRGLTSRGIRYVVQSMLERLPPLAEWMPAPALARLGLPELDRAIRAIHFPRDIAEAESARARFSFENLYLLQMVNFEQKMKLARERAPALAVDAGKIKQIADALPFALTLSQKKSLWEIAQDMEKPRPMNRLLQGDVGSGKTVVAVIATLIAAENGCQSAFMAPTEILARQHFETTRKLLAALPRAAQAPIGLLTGSGGFIVYESGLAEPVTRSAAAKKAANGSVAIVFGTHALIQKSVSFKNLALVVVDEQHRFGVRQRAELVRGRTRAARTETAEEETGKRTGGNGAGGTAPAAGRIPHFLSMSATPIPRTVMLTAFGDLDLSLINELPAGRKPIDTEIVPPAERDKAYGFLRKEVADGRQAFVICPRIEKPDEEAGGGAHGAGGASNAAGKFAAALDMRSVKEEYERLRTKVFPDLRIAMLHGQMKAKEKDEAMRRFKEGACDILVATSVVEVGVDVPNATVMLIEGADRFGLAQLYQFRGRIGRGGHHSRCFLMASTGERAENARLKAVVEAKNGFELAEKDLALRGPGQFFGEMQTGFPDAAMDALRDPGIVKASREAAAETLAADPSLSRAPLLRAQLAEFKRRLHAE